MDSVTAQFDWVGDEKKLLIVRLFIVGLIFFFFDKKQQGINSALDNYFQYLYI